MVLQVLISLPSFPLSKKEGNNWRTICEGTVTRQDEKRQRSVSGPDNSIRDAIPYSAVYEFATWRASSPSYRFRRSPCLCRSTLSEPVCSLSFHSSFIPFLVLPFLISLPILPTVSKKEGDSWRMNCEGTVTRQDEKRTRSVSGPDNSIRDAIPYSAVSELARWRASSPSYRFRRSPCLCRSILSEPVCSLSFHSSFTPFLVLPVLVSPPSPPPHCQKRKGAAGERFAKAQLQDKTKSGTVR